MAEDSGGGSGRPGWLEDKTGFEVDIDRLEQFAGNVKTELDSFGASFSGGIAAMMGDSGRFGGGGLLEGQSYASCEAWSREGLGLLIADVQKGLFAISSAAYAVSEEYQGRDALSQASIETTRGAFVGIEGRPLISDLVAQQRAAGQGGQGGAGGAEVPADIQEAVDANVKEDQDPTGSAGWTSDGQRIYYEDKPGEYRVPGDQDDLTYCQPVPVSDQIVREQMQR